MFLFGQLDRFVGKYRGTGINHESQNFVGEFNLSKGINSYSIHFKATGAKGELYHEDQTTIALSPEEKLCLWSVNTNNPVMLRHELRRQTNNDDAQKLVFGFNDIDNVQAFREEITLELYESGELGYRYSWGMPGGEFSDRSGLRMVKSL